MPLPEPPDGNAAFEKYELPTWTIAVAGTVLLALTLAICYCLQVSLGRRNIHFLLAVSFGLVSSLFVHESLHYIVADKLGYDPVYLWPNHVYVPDTHIELRHFLYFALAPQLLSIIFVGLLLLNLDPSYRLIIAIGLVSNLPGGCQDIVWALRRLTWPDGTKVVVSGDEKETYVSFPGHIPS